MQTKKRLALSESLSFEYGNILYSYSVFSIESLLGMQIKNQLEIVQAI